MGGRRSAKIGGRSLEDRSSVENWSKDRSKIARRSITDRSKIARRAVRDRSKIARIRSKSGQRSLEARSKIPRRAVRDRSTIGGRSFEDRPEIRSKIGQRSPGERSKLGRIIRSKLEHKKTKEGLPSVCRFETERTWIFRLGSPSGRAHAAGNSRGRPVACHRESLS